jgi:hypothetical protein
MQKLWKAPQGKQFSLGLLLLLVATSLLGWAQQSAGGQSHGQGRRPQVEDWSSLSLAGSELVPQKPTFGEKDDLPGFTRELIQVKWRDGDPIDLYVIRPKYVPKPPLVLYLYSYPSETDRFRDNDYCARITSGGVAAVGFVSALTGHRYTMRPMKEWFVSELQEALGSSVHDVQMVLNFLSQRDDLDASNVGMLGTGSGGTIAILAAAADPRIKAIDVLSPWGDWPDWMAKSNLVPENERANYLQPEFLKKVAPLDPVRWLPQVKAQHIRIQDIADDTITPKAARERIESAAPAAAKVQRYQSTREFYGAAGGGRLFQWVKDQLRAVPQTKPRVENTRSLQPARQIAEKHDD